MRTQKRLLFRAMMIVGLIGSPPGESATIDTAKGLSLLLRDRSLNEVQAATEINAMAFQMEKGAIKEKLQRLAAPSDSVFLARFQNPVEVRSTNGRLSTTLEIAYSDIKLWSMQADAEVTARLRTYNGKAVGPTIRVKAGDLMKITLQNRLPITHGAGMSGGHGGHDFNISNLHTHGLHVSPAGNSDNVLLAVRPGGSFKYDIVLPEDHHAGTFWYHAHVHGSTAIQVSSGMAGPLIVEGGVDEIPEIKAAKEEIFVFQQIPHLPNPHDASVREVEDFSQCFGHDVWNPGVASKTWHTTINGQTVPIVEMRPGEVHRWRLIHGGVGENIKLTLEGHSLYRIARDGICTGEIESDNEGREGFELAPGNRCDLLVKAKPLPESEATHDYLLIDAAMPVTATLLRDPKAPNVLAVVRVAGRLMDMALPAAADLDKHRPFPKTPILAENPPSAQIARFSIEFRPGSGPEFLVNGRTFDPAAPARGLALGATERWRVSSARANHPFHIHVNPFQVVEIRAPIAGNPGKFTNTLAGPYWCDTVLVKQDEEVLLNMTYADYVGRFVLHCHILDHEDRGMMEFVEIN